MRLAAALIDSLDFGLRRADVAVLAILSLIAAGVGAAEFDCLIEPRRFVTISGPIEALITNVRVDRGDFVRRGDVVVEFDSGVERASADLARFRAEMRGSIEAREARHEYAEAKFKRRSELIKENFISKQDTEETEAERRMAEADLREARDTQRVAELESRRAAEVLRTRSLISPISGIVVERYMHPGEVSEMSRKPILRLAEIGTLNVEVILPIAAYRQVERGDIAIVSPESPIGGRYEAKVMVVDRVMDASSGTFGIRLELPNTERAVPAGARCRIQFPKVTVQGDKHSISPRGATAVPSAAPPKR